jgi:hypothetical protein
MNPAVASVVTDPRIVVDDDRLVVDVGDVGDVNVGHATVVKEPVTLPISTVETRPRIPEAIINAAVKTNMWSPITAIPKVEAVIPAPVARGPKHSDGSKHPGARHPIVAIVVIPSPVTGGPDIAFPRAQGLDINGQRWRSDAN